MNSDTMRNNDEFMMMSGDECSPLAKISNRFIDSVEPKITGLHYSKELKVALNGGLKFQIRYERSSKRAGGRYVEAVPFPL